MKPFVISLVFTHFFCDWMLQPRKMAEMKSVSHIYLSMHLLINAIGLGICLLVFDKWNLEFVLINTFLHGLIDWNIWRGYKYFKFKNLSKEDLEDFINKNLYAKDYWFYSTIAFDQFLHLTILFYLFL